MVFMSTSDNTTPQVLAHSGVSNPLRILTTGADGDTMSVGAETNNYTHTISESGMMQGFLAFLNIASSTAGTTGTITCKIKRNGQTLTALTTDVSTFLAVSPVGIMFYDTLNFLAGAELIAGETFQLNIESNLIANPMTFDAKINIVYKPIARSYTA